MNVTETPRDLEPMAVAVRAMLGRSLGALIFRNVVLAAEVLESDDVVDRYRDQIFEHLLTRMTEDPRQAAPQLQFVLATRYLERIADHSTNICEDIISWDSLPCLHHGARAWAYKPDIPENNVSAIWWSGPRCARGYRVASTNCSCGAAWRGSSVILVSKCSKSDRGSGRPRHPTPKPQRPGHIAEYQCAEAATEHGTHGYRHRFESRGVSVTFMPAKEITRSEY